jgi:pimeloyl-ACP methyl ester carboxylesterase
MAARAWFAAFALQLALAAWMSVRWRVGGPVCDSGCQAAALAGVFAAVLCAVQLAFAAITMMLASVPQELAGASQSKSSMWARVVDVARRTSVVLREALAFGVSQCLMATEGLVTRSWADRPGSGRAPVLLIHGVYCNRAVWWAMRRRLWAAGVGPILAINLEPPGAAIDAHRAAVWGALQRLRALDARFPITIVAHSMGGLIARSALTDPPSNVPRPAQLITIATPHHGSLHARACLGGACVDMRPGSAWMRHNSSSHLPCSVTSIFSIDDNLVAPRSSATALGPAARTMAFRALGHFGLLWSSRVAAAVVAELSALTAPRGAASVAPQLP